MFGIGPQHLLGLALGEKTIQIAEVHAARGTPRLTRQATFTLTADAGWDAPEKLGAQLGRFLRDQKFRTHQACVGLPARWVLAQARVLPPVAPAATVNMLRLAVEQLYQADAREWACDFAGDSSAAGKSTALLAATPQQRLTQVQATLQAAGVQPRAITSTLWSLANLKSATDLPHGAVLYLSTEGVELAVRAGGRVVALERLTTALPRDAAASNSDPASHVALAGEIRRLLTSICPDTDVTAQPLIVWNAPGLPATYFDGLGTQLDWKIRTQQQVPDLTISPLGPTDHPQAADVPGACALALLGLRPHRLELDFLHSKLTLPTQGWLSRPRLSAVAAGLVLLAGLLYLAGDWYLEKRAVDNLQAELVGMKTDLAAARANVDRFNLASGWYDKRPAILECLRAVTLAFPSENSGGGSGGGGVWSTSLTVREDLSGTLAGKAQDEKNVLELLDRLRLSKKFVDVKLLYLRQAERGSRMVSFALTFVHAGRE